MMSDNSKQDVMQAEEILAEIRKLIDAEKLESEPNKDRDVSDLEAAATSMENFIADEKEESDEEASPAEEKAPEEKDVVDTSLLTGSISGLKNYLLKKQADNEAK